MDGEVVGATPPGVTGGGADALTGLAFLLVPDSVAYQAILGVLAEEPECSRTAAEVAEALGADRAIVESRLVELVGWGDVSRSAEVRTVAEYRAGAVRFGLSELGGRVWREVCRTSVTAAPEPVTEPVDREGLLELARRFDECSDAEAVALYAATIGLPTPLPGPGTFDTEAHDGFTDVGTSGNHESRAHHAGDDQSPTRDAGRGETFARPGRGPDTAAGPQPDPMPLKRFRSPPPSVELQGACADLARRRLSSSAFVLLVGLVGRALARTSPGSDGYVADESCGLELQLLHSPGSSTSLFGVDGTLTLDGFKLRLSVLPAEDPGAL
ncbi:DUF2397 family protein [Phytomonospora endophytica]|uniref:Uncharacterized protein n=1 Tax=Phytomonospora endophytica TaxID=714109 RepID=A0A841FDL5_9ACTN|nr:DUF2397 family protein [Phytomonospora endophytica]MBB6033904.1 hypothetical protein [Phytomonospora endophytica]GIG64575.1 hypothetical protein Pen01_08700 [Phytomonospora endophytica]